MLKAQARVFSAYDEELQEGSQLCSSMKYVLDRDTSAIAMHFCKSNGACQSKFYFNVKADEEGVYSTSIMPTLTS